MTCTSRGKRRGRVGGREGERELETTAWNNYAIVSCHLDRMYDKPRRHPRRAKATIHYVPSAAPLALAKGETTRVQCDNETITRYRFERGDRRWEHRDRVIRASFTSSTLACATAGTLIGCFFIVRSRRASIFSHLRSERFFFLIKIP